MKQEFTVIKSTESTNGGYVNTIETEKVTTVFGVKKTSKLRFLIKSDEEIAVGTKDQLDLAAFQQVQRESVVEDGTVITSTWLHQRVEA